MMELNIGSNVIRNCSGVLSVGGKDQIFLEVGNDGQLLLTMELYDETGKHVAKLRRNAWAFNEKGRFSITTNPDNLTLIDTATGAVVVRVQVVDRSRITIPEGLFFTHMGHKMEITPQHWKLAGSITMSRNTFDGGGGAVALS
jgi:hypothetical protein